jgi:hypothetical protein
MITIVLTVGCISILSQVGLGLYFTIRYTNENRRLREKIY